MGSMYVIRNNKLVEVQSGIVDDKGTPFDAVIEEYHGWQEYNKLYKETGEAKYAAAALDEFRHMLMRLSTAILQVNGMVNTDTERKEINDFLTALMS